jgi:two-component system, NtrC family, sensor kinase
MSLRRGFWLKMLEIYETRWNTDWTDFSTNFEENLPKIEVIPQDIGRVLLNLINNAFYAVNQRKQLSESSQLSESYTPSVSVSTQQVDNQIIIKIKDNGTGMPESVRVKVF